MKTYKGFTPDMTCRTFKYKQGEEYETDTAVCCRSVGELSGNKRA